MPYDEISKRTATSADNNSAVTINVPDIYIHHMIKVTTSGTTTTGTVTVTQEDSQSVIGSISLTAPVPYLFDGSFDSITVTPDTFDGDTFTVEIRSWKQLQG